MSKIYTKTGDRGQTSLFDGTRVPKNHIRVETYGTIDELNSVLGVAWSFSEKHKDMRELIEIIQRDLFDIGSHLANPATRAEEAFVVYLTERITFFENQIDAMTEKLPTLAHFILPSGGQTGAFLHLARTVARRAERKSIELSHQESVEPVFIKYLNRLSDLLFTMSRSANNTEKKKETIWTKFSGE